MPNDQHSLIARFQRDWWTILPNASVEVLTDSMSTGTAELTSGFLDFTWECTSIDRNSLEPFQLRPQRPLAMGNVYEAYSTANGDLIATIEDHKWNLFGTTALTSESPEGALILDRKYLDFWTNLLSLGLHREFDLMGAEHGHVECDLNFYEQIAIQYEVISGAVARHNAILLANVIVLTRWMAEHYGRRRGYGWI